MAGRRAIGDWFGVGRRLWAGAGLPGLGTAPLAR